MRETEVIEPAATMEFTNEADPDGVLVPVMVSEVSEASAPVTRLVVRI